jgi:hypothetical protein
MFCQLDDVRNAGFWEFEYNDSTTIAATSGTTVRAKVCVGDCRRTARAVGVDGGRQSVGLAAAVAASSMVRSFTRAPLRSTAC